MALMAGVSCHPNSSTEAKEPVYVDLEPALELPHCSSGEREYAICEQLKDIRLFRENGAELRKELQACHVSSLVAELSWHIDTEPPVDYKANVRFLESQVRGPLVPVFLNLRVFEWPCTDNCNHEDLKAVVPIVSQCLREPASRPTRDLVLPKVEESACAETGGLHHEPWCTRPTGPGEAHFVVREYHRGFSLCFELHIDFAADSAELEFNCDKFHLEGERVKLLREYLDHLWTQPTEGSRPCRHGDLLVIEGRRAGAWKVWFQGECPPNETLITVHHIVGLAGWSPRPRASAGTPCSK